MKTTNSILINSNKEMSKESVSELMNHKGTILFNNTKENRLAVKSHIDSVLSELRKNKPFGA